MHPEPFNPNSRLRASDADREQAADVLNTALAEGRLTVAEHSGHKQRKPKNKEIRS